MSEAVIRAEHAADAIRALNDITIHGDGGLGDPDNLFDCVHALALLAERLPQALEQIGRLVREASRREGLYDDRGADRNPQLTAAAAFIGQEDAIGLARQLGTALRGAANRLSHLGVRDA